MAWISTFNVTRKQRRRGVSGPGRGGHDHGVGAWRLASLRDWRRESRRFSAARFSAELMARGRALHSAKASSASRTSSSCIITSRSRVEQRRAATTSELLSSRDASNKSFSTSSAPLLDAIVSSSASETVRLSERYTLLARSASELLPLLDRRDGVLSELNWRDAVLLATGRGFAASPVASLVNAPAKETRMRSSTASGVAVQVAVMRAPQAVEARSDRNVSETCSELHL
ncbi:unnamed protein product [Pelagomonas calceolata]|uniref:Uncharacterized protein n=1 Tax=Pelagomonas calceolata TaxID=35677 RepID=A0A8J2WUW8_9STRA|nr:unnamed protein product [Pelagomonas calceolata]